MAEYINREALRDELLSIPIDTSNLYGCGILEGLDRATKRLNEQPAADVAPVVYGRWIASHDEFCTCSICKYPVYVGWNQTNYCPNCGAKMDGVDGNSDMT